LRTASAETAPVLRGRALEIVDERRAVRAGIQVLPAAVSKADGKAYAETVILRLIDPNGRPPVKLTRRRKARRCCSWARPTIPTPASRAPRAR